jgi:hypothetical protein
VVLGRVDVLGRFLLLELRLPVFTKNFNQGVFAGRERAGLLYLHDRPINTIIRHNENRTVSKQKRDRLFKGGRPRLRALNIIDGDSYHKDIALLWVAHQKSNFVWLPKDITQEEFAKKIEEISSGEELIVAEDRNLKYKDGYGPVALITVFSLDGWKYEPHAQFFPWCSTRNKLRVSVSFLQWARYQKNIGVCIVKSLNDSLNLFDKCCEYGVLHRIGRIVNGDPRGDETLYSVRGKK